MVTAGYSGTPLLKKLGIKENMSVMLIHEPENYFGLLEKILLNNSVKKMRSRTSFICLRKQKKILKLR